MPFMRVRILQGLSGAEQATGLAVVIDVFRAFTTALFVSANGSGRIVPVASEAAARALKAADPGAVLMGERGCIKLPGFDYGNSPADIEQVDFRGITVIQTTSAGTQGLEAAALRSGASEVVTGSFANAGAIVRHIRARAPEEVSLVALGTAGVEPSPEDTMCAMYLKNELEDFPNRFEALRRFLATVESAAKFFDPAKDYAPERDFELCMDLDRFGFVLRTERRPDGLLELHRVEIG
jgi:2-phosphosulfolactate phosphatase